MSIGGTRRLLVQACMACNREPGEPMCRLCQDLEDAEERADERREEHYADETA